MRPRESYPPAGCAFIAAIVAAILLGLPLFWLGIAAASMGQFKGGNVLLFAFQWALEAACVGGLLGFFAGLRSGEPTSPCSASIAGAGLGSLVWEAAAFLNGWGMWHPSIAGPGNLYLAAGYGCLTAGMLLGWGAHSLSERKKR